MAESSAIAQAETLLPFVESDPTASAEILRATMDEQGYLFFRRLVPEQAVLAARRDRKLCAMVACDRLARGIRLWFGFCFDQLEPVPVICLAGTGLQCEASLCGLTSTRACSV